MDWDREVEEAHEKSIHYCADCGRFGPCRHDEAARIEEVDPVEAELRYGQAVLPNVEGAAEADRKEKP